MKKLLDLYSVSVAVQASHTIIETVESLGIKKDNPEFKNYYRAVRNFIKSNSLDTAHFTQLTKVKTKRSVEEYLCIGSDIGSARLKERLYKQELIKEQCSSCGIGPNWNDNILVLQLDHINGINNDNRLENLRILCPNCHSQTDTFTSKTLKKIHECILCGKACSKTATRCKSCGIKNRKPVFVRQSKRPPHNCPSCGIKLAKKNNRFCRPCSDEHRRSYTKIIWPLPDELKRLVWEIPKSELAQQLGISDVAIAKRCKYLGIPVPARGYWQKLRSVP